MIDDFEEEWFYSHTFDYIHGRELAGSVKDFDRLFEQCFKYVKPGGYVEMQSFRIELFSDDESLEKKATSTNQWVSLLHEASIKFGKVMINMDEWEGKMRKAGFEDVTMKVTKVPMSPWPEDPKEKEIGKFMQVEQLQAMPAYTQALLTRVLSWTKEETDILLAKVASELKDLSIHQYSMMYIVYGRKPDR